MEVDGWMSPSLARAHRASPLRPCVSVAEEQRAVAWTLHLARSRRGEGCGATFGWDKADVRRRARLLPTTAYGVRPPGGRLLIEL
jgi:hypothetical protein